MFDLLHRRSLLALVAVAAISGLSACGQGSDANDSGSADTASDNSMSMSSSDSAADNTASGENVARDSEQPDFADGDALRNQLIGNTLTGKMSSGAGYGEYYAPDGQVLAATYTAKWEIKSDRLCYDAGQGTTCYGVVFNGLDVVLYDNGKVVGNGTIQPGNPNDFTAEKAKNAGADNSDNG